MIPAMVPGNAKFTDTVKDTAAKPTFPHVLVLSGVKGATRRYRTFHPFEQLNLAGVHCTLSHLTDPQLLTKIKAATIVILHRTAYDRYVADLLKHSKLTIFDVDDLVFDPSAFSWIDSPDFQDRVRAKLYREEMVRYRQTLLASQAVLASTQYLADRVRELEKPVWVHRNGFSLEMLAHSEDAVFNRKPFPERVIIGYASGTRTHDRDFQTVKPALQHILHQHPHVELRLIGPLDPGQDWGSLGERIRQDKFVPWRALPGHLANFDINIAPLITDNPFGQSKSEIKFMEAGLVQVPTIASPTKAFKQAIHHGENGLLADDVETWIGALNQLIEDPDARKEMGTHARQGILTAYHPTTRGEELRKLLGKIYKANTGESLWNEHVETKDMRSTPRDQKNVQLINSEQEHQPTLIRMGLYNLKHRGARILAMQVWVFVRRLITPLFPFR